MATTVPRNRGRRWLSKSLLLGQRKVDIRQEGAVSGHLYGAIIVLAVLIPADEDSHHPYKVAAIVAVTVGVLLFMEAFADVIGREISLQRTLTRPERMGIARRFLSVVSAAEAPLVFLVLAGIGFISLRAGFRLAEAATLTLLFYYAFLAGRLADRSVRWSTSRALLAALLGVGLAVLKSYAHL